jgi:hypothetical protein
MEIDPRYIGIKYAEMFKCAFWWCACIIPTTNACTQTHTTMSYTPYKYLLYIESF